MAGRHPALRLRHRLARLGNAVLGHGAVALLRLLRRASRHRTANVCATVLRTVGPWLPEHRVGRANLKTAFPDKSDAEIETILRGVWDNLGRVAAEFAHLDRIRVFDAAKADTLPGDTDIDYTPQTLERFHALRLDGKPALIFTAHLANWELPAQVAHQYGLDTVVLYRRPNIGAIADAIAEIRQGSMGKLLATGLDAPVALARDLKAGAHAAMLVDQHYSRGVEVTFFGRPARTNPLIARLARQIECPIHGVRVIRRLGDRFTVELSDAVAPVRDSDGKIDVTGTMQVITGVVEGWVREYPDQWLWVHRRWR